MVDANEKDEVLKSDLTPEKDADQSVLAPATTLSTTIMTLEKTVVASGISNNIKEEEKEQEKYEEEEEDDEEEAEEDEEDEEEEEEAEEEEEEEGKEKETEEVNDEGRGKVAVNNEGLNIDEEHNKEKAIAEKETNEENAVKEDAIRREDEITEERKNGEKLGENSKGKGRRPRKRKRKKKTAQKASEKVAVDGDKPESSSKKKASKRVESMGMVFMCSSKTKADCFRYKILGLPASKKDQVAKIYKGMRLFLFDVDLRLMYGIFKAAAPGGYNIEPKAFQSAFPSQVRFSVIEDCLPLAEEKFKAVIKENYYSRSKFEGQLNAEQVKKLCRLFIVAGIGGPSPESAIRSRRNGTDENRRTRAGESRRTRADESRRTRADVHASRDRGKRKRRAQEEERHPRPSSGRETRRYHDYERPPVVYEREALPSLVDPIPRYLPLPRPAPPSPVRSYVYERALEVDPYVRDRDRIPEHHTFRVLDTEPRHRDEIISRDRDRDPYRLYSREAPPYRDTAYPLPPEYRLVSRDYHPPTVQPNEYRLSGGLPSYRDAGLTTEYRSSAASLPEYQPRRPHYRY